MKRGHIMKIKPIKAFFLHYKEHSSTFFFFFTDLQNILNIQASPNTHTDETQTKARSSTKYPHKNIFIISFIVNVN